MGALPGNLVVLVCTEDTRVCMAAVLPLVLVENRVVTTRTGSTQPLKPLCTLVMESEQLRPFEMTAWLHDSDDWPSQRLDRDELLLRLVISRVTYKDTIASPSGDSGGTTSCAICVPKQVIGSKKNDVGRK